MKQHVDLQWVEAACAGDTVAIEALLGQVQPSITCFARKYCATAQDVEDAVQETLWVIYRKIRSLRSTAAFVSWTFQIVRHHCLALLSPTQRIGEVVDISILDYMDHSLDPELVAALRSDVIGAIARLPATYRQILILRDVEGYSAPEVADRLGITIQTVKSRLHRARRLLRASLDGWRP